MDGMHLLNDKYMAEKLPETCAQRRQLMKKLELMANKRIIYFSAPAGYGKTVSTKLWLANSGRETIWITLDAYDNSIPIFYKLFCTGILSIQPKNSSMATILKNGGFASTPVEHTIRLLAEFVPDGKKYAIVLDDFHLLNNNEIRKSGLLVQKRLPLQFTTVILTRNAVRDEYIQITGRDRTAVIKANQLTFSEDEIRDYFVGHGFQITNEESKSVYGITGGWPMGVNALAMSGQIEIGHNGGQILENYIKTNIWDCWEDELRDFMLKTCVVDEMDAGLCDKLTGRDDSGEVLEELCAKNSFISRGRGDSYRYHQLFLEFLRSMRGKNDETPDQQYKIAAEYYLETGKYLTARRFALKSDDSDVIARAVYTFIQSKDVVESVDGYVNFFHSLIEDDVPKGICSRNPYLYAFCAWYYLLVNDAGQMARYMDLLHECLPVIAERHPQFLENSVLVSFLDPRKYLSELIRRFDNMLSPIRFNPNFQGVSLSLHLPYAHRTIRDYSELTDRRVMQALSGTFGKLFKTQSEAVNLLLQSGFLYEQNRLGEALESALKTRSIINDELGGEIVFCSFTHLASIYFALGDIRKFTDTMMQAERLIEENGAHYLMPNFIAFKTRLRLLNGDITAAKAWLKNYFVTDEENFELYKVYRHFTTVRANIILAQSDAAMYYVRGLRQLGRDFCRPLDMAEAGVLQAILEWNDGKKEAALSTLKTVLVAMQEFGFIRVVASEGAAVLPILKRLLIINEKEGGGMLDPHYLNIVTIAAYEQSRRHKGVAVWLRKKPVKLSKRQRQILTLLSKGYRNADIVEETGITIHTVKSHCAAAYDKLGVNNAMDAVIKAREMGFID